MKHSKVTSAGIVCLLLAGPVLADTPWDALVQFGLTGSWARNCSNPPNLMVFWSRFFQEANGRVRVRVDRGPDVPPLTYAVQEVRILSPTTINLLNFNDDPDWGLSYGDIFDVVMIKQAGRVRTLESKTLRGEELAKNGVNIASGQPTTWLEKCGN